jgi:lipopolysaccharide export system protein LptA
MLKHNCITKCYFCTLLVFFLFVIFLSSQTEAEEKSKEPIVVTSDSLIADKRKNLITFKGSVVAKTKDMTINSDRMQVTYDNKQRIDQIKAIGNVIVESGDGKIYSQEATYFNKGEKVVFTGDPRAVDGENVITGNKITYYLKDERVEVEGSKVYLKENVEGITQSNN